MTQEMLTGRPRQFGDVRSELTADPSRAAPKDGPQDVNAADGAGDNPQDDFASAEAKYPRNNEEGCVKKRDRNRRGYGEQMQLPRQNAFSRGNTTTYGRNKYLIPDPCRRVENCDPRRQQALTTA